ncbi:hypothetical protein Goshw_005719 [Gossypium schwendimanii]|uniref:Uncharacterized protein n=1 Tax=Gossypium schwendimanii TaxID=34291 RepID=A0A7J9MMU4_GOSSC|nr:hypothetical protein [Gossypium schwendimanii]
MILGYTLTKLEERNYLALHVDILFEIAFVSEER